MRILLAAGARAAPMSSGPPTSLPGAAYARGTARPRTEAGGAAAELLCSPWDLRFDALLERASSSLLLCAPFVGRGPCDRVRNRLASVGRSFRLSLVADLSPDNILSGATDVCAIADVLAACPGADLRFLPSLHAKVYVADDRCAVVTSANLTDAGLRRNFEYGVLFSDPEIVRSIREDVLRYAALGSPISQGQLKTFAVAASELLEMRRAADKKLKSKLRSEFERRLREFDDDILRARIAGRTPHAIFADAILMLLRERPMATRELNPSIQGIHPDLCDDSVDRVIDGRHFGKKWKHAVRSAQAHLKREGAVFLEGGKWHIAP